MKRLILLILVGLAAWQAWIHYPDLMHPGPRHEVVIENLGPVPIERMRVTMGDLTQVRETITPAERVRFKFPAGVEGPFHMVWVRAGSPTETEWRGGHARTMPERHIFSVQEDGSVSYQTEKVTPTFP